MSASDELLDEVSWRPAGPAEPRRVRRAGPPRLRLLRSGSSERRDANYAELWAAYWADATRVNRDALLAAYAELVLEAANATPRDEVGSGAAPLVLASAGRLGLMGAVEDFASGSDVGAFTDFATPYVRHAVHDALNALRESAVRGRFGPAPGRNVRTG